jgi:hypothetical protein
MLDSYFTDDQIIYYLCRIRAKYAKKRCKKHLIHLLSNDPKLNHHIDEKSSEEVILYKILPHRRKWKKLGKEYRYKNKFQKINSIEYNTKCILKTVQYYQRERPLEPFLIRLNQFINEVRKAINDPKFEFDKPKIYPKLKDKKDISGTRKNICRPICIFNLKDKLIISQTNKYLLSVFDPEFYELSHAFRFPNKDRELITHHSSVEEILKYKSSFKGNELFVAECDMSKFFDTVSHLIIHKHFWSLLDKIKKNNHNIDEKAIRIFFKYLRSYNFVRDVLPLNDNLQYWETNKISNGEFGWVKEDLVRLKHYNSIENARIGIPQGGAISCLIANIVLHYADSIMSNRYKNLLYIRFCDDMILMHPSEQVCDDAINKYKKVLLDLKLVPHEFRECHTNTKDEFWKCKSKSPYKWSSNYREVENFPWIGFVGYEIHFDGYVRVRKSSLKKERKKQNEVVEKIKAAISDDHRRARKGTIIESAINRLIGMSVGRVQMWNHSEVDHDLCWVNGFRKLNNNQYLQRQLRYLDKNRNHQIACLKKEVAKYTDPEIEREKPNRKLIFYGKPFSYYYQVIDKNKKDN